MASPFTSASVSGYNSNPPPDDGSQTEANRVKWATIKTKLPDPLKTALEADITNTAAAFGKTFGSASVSSTGVSYQVLSSDQGKLIRATAASVTITTPSATDVASPFCFAVLNNSSGSITVDGSGSQTIDGSANITLASGQGCILNTDGTNWFSTGLPGVLIGSQMQYGMVLNGTISASVAANAITFSLLTLAGGTPSVTDPVVIAFRNANGTVGNYVYRTVTSATTLTISSGSTLGATSGEAFRVWLVLFDDAGTIRLGAINCRNGKNIFALGRHLPAGISSTAEGGAGGADSAHVFYTGTAVSAKAYVLLGFATYESGLATAGTWNVAPTSLQLFGPGIPLPGQEIQSTRNSTGALQTGTTPLPTDDTIPQITEGNEYMTQAITPASAAHLLEIEAQAEVSHNANGNMTAALFQDATANALAAAYHFITVDTDAPITLLHCMVAGTTSSTTFRLRAGSNGVGTTTFNGAAGARLLGGVMNSYLNVREIMT